MKVPRYIHNTISYVGAGIAGLALFLFLFLLVLQSLTEAGKAPYAGLITFVFVPAVLLVGGILIPIGMFREWRYVKRTGAASIREFPIINLNDPRQRNITSMFLLGGLCIIVVTVFSGFQAYEATESIAFCGALCHRVMEPEYVAYQYSPHARVRCVDCHVGPGAQWYVKSKLTGLYQVYAVTFHKYPQPIPGPITSLRPAQQTCEQCHWPDKFFEAQLRRQVHFLSDDDNSRWEIDLLIKTGGGQPGGSRTGGIHWHMNIENKVEYIATDAQRQKIPWLRITNVTTGQSTEYNSVENPLSEAEKATATHHRMDCMDCHNRPSHIYRPPRTSVNFAMASGLIDPSLPAIKRTAVELLAADYPTKDAAFEGIAEGLRKVYQEKYPDVFKNRGAALAQATRELQAIYARSVFPYMRVRWDTYADNIGHLMFPGCFRCHDGKLQTADGKVLSKDCRSCHAITAQGKPGAMQVATERDGLEFEHPVDIGTLWQETPCNECHTGGAQ